MKGNSFLLEKQIGEQTIKLYFIESKIKRIEIAKCLTKI